MKYGPLSVASKTLLDLFRIKPILINAGPKIFAAKIGFVCSLLISVFYVSSHSAALLSFGIMLMVCSFLEAFFNFCIGCKMYTAFTARNYIFFRGKPRTQ